MNGFSTIDQSFWVEKPRTPVRGVYCLFVRLKKSCRVTVGSLGSIFFKKGDYVYVGSAMNGLENRIARHIRKEKKLHWHIDYLLASKSAKIKQVFVKETSDKKEECRTAKKIATFGEPVKNFGCGDCRCEGHLISVNKAEVFDFSKKAFKTFIPNSLLCPSPKSVL